MAKLFYFLLLLVLNFVNNVINNVVNAFKTLLQKSPKLEAISDAKY